jgi:hypothetical protein
MTFPKENAVLLACLSIANHFPLPSKPFSVQAENSKALYPADKE